jgi:hypothetical protein
VQFFRRVEQALLEEFSTIAVVAEVLHPRILEHAIRAKYDDGAFVSLHRVETPIPTTPPAQIRVSSSCGLRALSCRCVRAAMWRTTCRDQC